MRTYTVTLMDPDDGKFSKDLHPTQKPVALMVWCIAQAKLRDDSLILDPFAGSCTTAIACIRTNRRCICIEKERKYFDIGVQRVRAEYARAPLFAEVSA